MTEPKSGRLETVSDMTKGQLVDMIKDLLKTDGDLGFLLALKNAELEKFVSCIRDRIDRVEYQ